MKIEDLLSAGYKKFEDRWKNSDCGYQKRIGRTRYFINVYYYDFRKFNLPYNESFECELNFQLKEDEHINLSFCCKDLTIEQLEGKVEWLFTTLNCIDYEEAMVA